MATTDCSANQLEFSGFGRRRVEAAPTAGRTSTDGGLLLLREVEKRRQLVKRFAACFADYRRPDLIEHTVEELVGQRVFGLACGYEDLNDHDRLRDDVALAIAVGKQDLLGEHRARERDVGHPLSGKSTLNRLELTPEKASAEAR